MAPPDGTSYPTYSPCPDHSHNRSSGTNDDGKNTSTSTSTNSNANAEDHVITSTLLSTARHLQIRSEVSSTLSALLSDVESSTALSQTLRLHHQISTLQSDLRDARRALAERRALELAESDQRKVLGDVLVVELSRLAGRLAELDRWKAEHEGMVEEWEGLHGELREVRDRAAALELAVRLGDEDRKEEEEREAKAKAKAKEGEEVIEQEQERQHEKMEDTKAKAAGPDKNLEGLAAVLVDDHPTREAGKALLPSKIAGSETLEVAEPAEPAKSVEASGSGTKERSGPVGETGYTTTATAVVPNGLSEKEADDSALLEEEEDEDKTEVEVEAEAGLGSIGDEGALVVDTKTNPFHPDKQQKQQQPKRKRLVPPPMEIIDPEFQCVPEKVLMSIFAHLEAHDILSTAQVSIIMYSRVDILFGLGGSVGNVNGDGSNNAEVVADEMDAAAVATSEDLTDSATAENAAANAPNTAAATAPAASATATSGLALAGGFFSGLATKAAEAAEAAARGPSASSAPSAPPSSAATAPDSAASASASASATSSGGADAPSAADGGSALVSGNPAAGGTVVKGRAPMLTPELANSMAEKLTRDELAVIISMQRNAKNAETDLEKIRNERDDLHAELKGVESVKDFLVTKLRDVERAQRMALSEKEKVSGQIASDQEVIGFLDSRVQELEGMGEASDMAKARLEEEIKDIKAKNNDRVRLLSDQLRFERDQLSTNEKEWKQTKKLLVKEVKQCRAQIIGLEAERDGLKEENIRLREALLNGGKM